jgi:hypothetical protein
MVAVAGIEHGLEAYETSVPPIHYPAINGGGGRDRTYLH